MFFLGFSFGQRKHKSFASAEGTEQQRGRDRREGDVREACGQQRREERKKQKEENTVLLPRWSLRRCRSRSHHDARSRHSRAYPSAPPPCCSFATRSRSPAPTPPRLPSSPADTPPPPRAAPPLRPSPRRRRAAPAEPFHPLL